MQNLLDHLDAGIDADVHDGYVLLTDASEFARSIAPTRSTTVEIDLGPTGGGTELRLVHRGLPGPMAHAHAGGWNNYLDGLATVAERRDPRPDPLADERVPSARSLGLA